jgi:hypothetical protein
VNLRIAAHPEQRIGKVQRMQIDVAKTQRCTWNRTLHQCEPSEHHCQFIHGIWFFLLVFSFGFFFLQKLLFPNDEGRSSVGDVATGQRAISLLVSIIAVVGDSEPRAAEWTRALGPQRPGAAGTGRRVRVAADDSNSADRDESERDRRADTVLYCRATCFLVSALTTAFALDNVAVRMYTLGNSSGDADRAGD